MLVGLFDLKQRALCGFRQRPVVGISTEDLLNLLFCLELSGDGDRLLYLPSLCRTGRLQVALVQSEPDALVMFSVFTEPNRRLALTVDPTSFIKTEPLESEWSGRLEYTGESLDAAVTMNNYLDIAFVDAGIDEIVNTEQGDWWILQRRKYRIVLQIADSSSGKEGLLEFDRLQVPEILKAMELLAD